MIKIGWFLGPPILSNHHVKRGPCHNKPLIFVEENTSKENNMAVVPGSLSFRMTALKTALCLNQWLCFPIKKVLNHLYNWWVFWHHLHGCHHGHGLLTCCSGALLPLDLEISQMFSSKVQPCPAVQRPGRNQMVPDDKSIQTTWKNGRFQRGNILKQPLHDILCVFFNDTFQSF